MNIVIILGSGSELNVQITDAFMSATITHVVNTRNYHVSILCITTYEQLRKYLVFFSVFFFVLMQTVAFEKKELYDLLGKDLSKL